MLKVELTIKMPAENTRNPLEGKAYSVVHIYFYGAYFSLKSVHSVLNGHLFFRIQDCLSRRMVRKLLFHVVDQILQLPPSVFSMLKNFFSRCSTVTDNRFIVELLKYGVIPNSVRCCHGTCQDGKQKQDG
jgi:hypothetical protein